MIFRQQVKKLASKRKQIEIKNDRLNIPIFAENKPRVALYGKSEAGCPYKIVLRKEGVILKISVFLGQGVKLLSNENLWHVY